MTSRTLESLILGLTLVYSVQAHAFEAERQILGGVVEGLALGDVQGDGRLETAITLRNGTWTKKGTAGSVVLTDPTGVHIWEHESGKNIAGHPTMADFDRDGYSEIAYCELNAHGVCTVLDGNGTVMWSTPELYYPGGSGVAPAAADLTGDGKADVVVSSWGGTVLGLNGESGEPLWRFEAFTVLGESLFANPLLVDLNLDGIDDVVLAGATRGIVFALNGRDGQLLWQSPQLRTLHGNHALGNGALATQLVTGGAPELVFTLAGKSGSAVFGFSSAGDQLFRTPVPGYLDYMSAVAADIDRDFVREIFIQSGNGQLYQLSSGGALLRSVSIGTNSWVPPAFIDSDGDGVVEVLAATKSSLVLLDGPSLIEIGRYDHIAAGIQPSPVVADRDRDGRVEFLVGTWYGTDLLSSEFAARSPYRWAMVGGDAQHSGEHALSGQSGSVVAQLTYTRDVLLTDPELRSEKASYDTSRAIEAYLRGDPVSAVRAMRQAVGEMAHSSTPNPAEPSFALAFTALEMVKLAIVRAQGLGGSAARRVALAQTRFGTAEALIGAGNISAALQELEKAVQDAGTVSLDEDGHCDQLVLSEEVFTALECEFLAKMTSQKTSAPKAYALLVQGINTYPTLRLMTSFANFARAVPLMDAASAASLVEISGRMARFFIDEARLGLGPVATVAAADILWEQAYQLQEVLPAQAAILYAQAMVELNP